VRAPVSTEALEEKGEASQQRREDEVVMGLTS
jgi:hypothetical protein